MIRLGISTITIGDISSAVTVLIASIALVITYKRYLTSIRESRLSLAKSLYKDYLKLAFDNQKFASPSYPKENPKYKEIQENPVEFERYCHYVSLMLFAAEEILEINKESINWYNTWYNQLKKHALYFEGGHFNPSDWSKGIVDLCNDSISAYHEGGSE